MANDWSKAEVEAAVEDYFNMLRAELTGDRYNKTGHRHALMQRLNRRTNGSVELKHQNISAVLIEMGVPYIDGYKPRFNYQRSLVPAVSGYLSRHPELHALFKADVEVAPEVPTVEDFLSVMESPPAVERHTTQRVSETFSTYHSCNVNYLEQESKSHGIALLATLGNCS